MKPECDMLIDLDKIIKENKSCYSFFIKRYHRELYDEIFKLDGSTFSEKLYFYKHGIRGVCKECRNQTPFIGINDGYREYCSNRCVNKNLEIRERIKSGFIKKYGVDNVSKDISIKEKKKQTFFNRYGVSSPFGIKAVKEKRIRNAKKYIDCHRSSILYRLKEDRRKSFIDQCENGERLGSEIEALFDIDSFTNIKDRMLKFRCKICKNIFHHHLQWGVIPICWRCHPNSGFQDEVTDFFQNTKLIVFPNVRNVIRGELDVYIPSIKLAVECNGVYWHSCKRKNQYYHLNKTIQCEDKNIKLIHLFENEWNDATKNLLSSILSDKFNFDGSFEVDRRIFNKVFFQNKKYQLVGESMPEKKLFGGYECWDCGTLSFK